MTGMHMHVYQDPANPCAPIPVERRETERAATVFTIGKLELDSRDLPCMVRDISEGGMRVRMADPPPIGTPVRVEMRGLEPRDARVRWAAERDAGLAFEQPCDLAAVFEARSRRTGQIARQPRFNLKRDVRLVVADEVLPAEVTNISVGGARLNILAPVVPGEPAFLQLRLGHGADVIAATVQWSRNGECGVRFARPMSSLALAMALQAAQR